MLRSKRSKRTQLGDTTAFVEAQASKASIDEGECITDFDGKKRIELT
jgi:hypothetical protein